MAGLFTIAPHAPFLETLTARILEGTLPRPEPGDPFGLADLTIFVPTRRARAALADAFARALGGTLLLPDIRTLGEVDEEEEPFLPPYPAPQLQPAISPLARRLTLARLVEGWIRAEERVPFSTPGASGFASPPSAAEILSLADSLGTLIDDCLIEGIDPLAIKSIPPENLSAVWQRNIGFLSLVLEVWPNILKERGRIEGADARNQRLAQQAKAMPLVFARRPVIAAGSTGSIPATAGLLTAIAKLPYGAVVLPGLDTTLTPQDHEALLDRANAPHGHPQYGLMKLLRLMGSGPGAVTELATQPENARTTLVRGALAPAEKTAHWSRMRAEIADNTPSANGLALVAARTQEEEARAVAIAAREGLAAGRSVGIVTPDRNLARRVAAELGRFAVVVDDSAGTPLFQSPMGRLARQAAALAGPDWTPVDLVALLRNRFTGLGLVADERDALTDLLEISVLRGQQLAGGAQGLKALIAANLAGTLPHPRRRLSETEAERLNGLVAALENALAPLAALRTAERVSAAGLAAALGETLALVRAAPEPGPLPGGGPEFQRWVEELAGQSDQGPALAGKDALSALYGLMAGITVRPPAATARTDIAILGLLEARLLDFGLTVLCGLNEGVWPQAADPGPWLSRGMALAAGLEPPERRQGQMAHDFAMALGGEQVVLAYAERLGTAPADPSRLVQRLTAFAGADAAAKMLSKGQVYVDMARRLDLVTAPKPAVRPTPAPPARLRPRRLRVTEIETLIRSPYDLYARHVLGLTPLDPLGHDPDMAERGNLIHQVLGDFIAEGNDPAAPGALEKLLGVADAVFAGLSASPARRAAWRHRFTAQAKGFIEFEQGRAETVAARHVERSGNWRFAVAGEPFALSGRADRIDVLKGGGLEILDFKTGGVPDKAAMTALLAPQLLAEAKMAAEGVFSGVPAGAVTGLRYLKLSAGPQAFEAKPFELAGEETPMQAADRLFERLQRHIATYLLSDTQPLPPRIFPDPKQRYVGDYEHLSRAEEWTLVEDGGEDVE